MLLSIVLSRILYYIDSIKDLDLILIKRKVRFRKRAVHMTIHGFCGPLVNIQRCMQQLFPIRGELQERHLPRIVQTQFEPCSNRPGLLKN